MTTATLRTYTCKHLAQMAKREGVVGWHSMRKEELVRALASASRRTKRQGAAKEAQPSKNGHQDKSQLQVRMRIDDLRTRLSTLKNLATEHTSHTKGSNGSGGERTDRLVLMVRDPYWLQAHWELSPSSVDRARTALGHNWHTARPVLRLYRVLEDGSSTPYRDVAIHGGVNHWYIDVADPPQKYRAEIGYRAGESDFYCLSRSNIVTTPTPGSTDAIGSGWNDVAENADRIFAMSGGYSERGTSVELQQLLEERLKCRLGRPTETRFGNGAGSLYLDREELRFAIDCEIIIYGATSPHAHVTVEGEPVNLRPDGTFAVRLPLPDRRQVIPVIASAPDGVEQKTIVLGLERNTKELEPMLRDSGHQG